MKKIVLFVFVLTTFCVAASAQKNGGKDDDFAGLIKQNYAGWSTLNPANVAPMYANDPGLVFFDLAPLKYGSWAEYRSGFEKNFVPTFSSLTLTPANDLKVMRSGNLAVTTSTFHLSAKQKDGTAMEMDGRHTVVWQKRVGKWLIVHEHVSKPL